MRLIVTDNSTAARTMADRLAEGKPERREVHGVEVLGAPTWSVIATGGLLFAPAGDPPRWEPARRAVIRALRLLARTAGSLELATDDPLLAAQARDIVCEGHPALLRGTRMHGAGHVDELAAQRRAVALEADAVFTAHLTPVDPDLDWRDLPALRSEDRFTPPDALARLAERGYLAGEPAWRAPAGELLCDALDGRLLRRATAAAVDGWIDAVGRGTLTRPDALARIRLLVGELAAPVRPEGLDRGRLLGVCPECGEWMGGARTRLACMGCGLSYPIPRTVEALAVPGATCEACDAPMILPVVRGRRHEPRCPDTGGCPTRLDVRVGA